MSDEFLFRILEVLVHILIGYHHMNSIVIVVHCLLQLLVQEGHYSPLNSEVW